MDLEQLGLGVDTTTKIPRTQQHAWHLFRFCETAHVGSYVTLIYVNTVNLSQFVVDLRSRHLGYWNQFAAPDPRVSNSNRLTYHQWCAVPVRNAHAIDPPYTMPKYTYLDLPHHVLRNTARFRLLVQLSELNRLLGPKMKNMCCSDVPIPRSALFVKSLPHFSSTTSLFYTSTSPTGCPV
eukprot:125562-Pelagomonas_calceolata.AAC.1